MKTHFTIIVLALLVLLTACTASPQADGTSTSAAAQTLETYLKALTEKNEAGVTSAVCPDWETDALLEYDAFASVETSLDGLSCQQTGTDGNAALVTCQGKIKASYANEAQEFD